MSTRIKFFTMIYTGFASTLAMAGPSPNTVFAVPQSIPAVSQAGLIALAFIVGLMGAHLIRKSKADSNQG